MRIPYPCATACKIGKPGIGELLCLALASCLCNDIYRDSTSLKIDVLAVDVEVRAEFGGIGEAAKSICYTPTVKARASEEEIQALIIHTDRVM